MGDENAYMYVCERNKGLVCISMRVAECPAASCDVNEFTEPQLLLLQHQFQALTEATLDTSEGMKHPCGYEWSILFILILAGNKYLVGLLLCAYVFSKL